VQQKIVAKAAVRCIAPCGAAGSAAKSLTQAW
jgi:hypothetical protein